MNQVNSTMKRTLCNLCRETILIELEVLLEFIIGRHNLNNIRYTNDTENKFIDMLVKESRKKRLTINYKIIECIVVSKKDSPGCELRIEENHASMKI